MKARLDIYKSSPASIQALQGLDDQIAHSGLDRPLITLVRLRASQINEAGACIAAETRAARAAGESEQRLSALVRWREVCRGEVCFSDRECAALEWTEAVTLIADSQVPDAVWNRVKPHFTPEELVDLTLLVASINSWNRFAISFRIPPV